MTLFPREHAPSGLAPTWAPRAPSSRGLTLCSLGLDTVHPLGWEALCSHPARSPQVTELVLAEDGNTHGPRGTGLARKGSRGRLVAGRLAASGQGLRAHGRCSDVGRGQPVPPQLPGGGQRHPARPRFRDPNRRGQPQGAVLGGLLGVGHRDRSCREQPKRLRCSSRAQSKSRSRGGGRVGSRGNPPFLEGSASTLCGPWLPTGHFHAHWEKVPPRTRASAGSRRRMGHKRPLPSTHALGCPSGMLPSPVSAPSMAGRWLSPEGWPSAGSKIRGPTGAGAGPGLSLPPGGTRRDPTPAERPLASYLLRGPCPVWRGGRAAVPTAAQGNVLMVPASPWLPWAAGKRTSPALWVPSDA